MAKEQKYDALKIKGYRALSDEEIALINSIKLHGEALGQQIRNLRDTAGTDLRWIDIGETHLQHGIMALCRSVAKPEGF
jgi:hypothetical protein